MRAHQLDDLCGLRIMTLQHWRTGGYSYLHRRVPIYRVEWEPPEGAFNYVIAESGPGEPIAVDGKVGLFRVRSDGCRPDPAFTWSLE
jgi:hypothetical protein